MNRVDELRLLYQSFATDFLRLLRLAFVLDAEAVPPTSDPFVALRVEVIDAILKERGELP